MDTKRLTARKYPPVMMSPDYTAYSGTQSIELGVLNSGSGREVRGRIGRSNWQRGAKGRLLSSFEPASFHFRDAAGDIESRPTKVELMSSICHA
jgi:hypothetical protein